MDDDGDGLKNMEHTQGIGILPVIGIDDGEQVDKKHHVKTHGGSTKPDGIIFPEIMWCFFTLDAEKIREGQSEHGHTET